ncbi:MAG: PfkB family carbohydrate kinase [Candidatus Krumholzibacteriia bacterium]
MSILVVGSVAYDTVETPRERRERQLGGSASYFAVAARRHGPIRVVGVVGDDFLADDLALLEDNGADLDGVVRATGPSFHWSGRYHLDMIERDTLLTELGVFAEFRPDIPAAWQGSEYLFLANIHPALQRHVLDQMDEPRLVVLDTMNLWIETTREDLVEVLSRVDVLLVNEGEARQLTGERSLQRAATRIQEMGPARVVVKKGEHGALLFGRDRLLAVPGLILEDVGDPTGSGDSFGGGFVGALAGGGGHRDSDDALFRQAMLNATAVASFCAEDFSVGGLLRMTHTALDNRLERLRSMMAP